MTNVLEYSQNTANSWAIYTNIIGSGLSYSVIDSSADSHRAYRVKLFY